MRREVAGLSQSFACAARRISATPRLRPLTTGWIEDDLQDPEDGRGIHEQFDRSGPPHA